MNTKKRIIRLIETYINDFKKNSIEEMYGRGTRIKINDLQYSTNNSSLMVESIIILGDLINEDVMNRELADLVIHDALKYFYPDLSVKIYVRWDV